MMSGLKEGIAEQRIRELIGLGKNKGGLRYLEITNYLKGCFPEPGKIEEVIEMFDDLGIDVMDKPRDKFNTYCGFRPGFLLVQRDDDADNRFKMRARAAYYYTM